MIEYRQTTNLLGKQISPPQTLLTEHAETNEVEETAPVETHETSNKKDIAVK